MSITIRDPDLLARLAGKRGSVELRDAAGETVGRVITTWPRPPSTRDQFLERVADSSLIAEFARARQPVLVFDPGGELVGLFERMWQEMPPAAYNLRLEELRRAARKEKGHTLAEVWKIIFEKYVGDDVEPFIVQASEAAE